MKYITIWFDPKKTGKKKTNVWNVFTSDGQLLLGEVKWFARWRKYAFFPQERTLFEERCMRDIADWCETWTREHKRVLKSLKEMKRRGV